MLPVEDHDERIWLALSHLQMAPDVFLCLLADVVPEAKDSHCWLVVANPLLQLRSVLLNHVDSEWGQLAPYVQLCALLGSEDKWVTATGRLTCGIYTRRMFLSCRQWRDARQLAAESLLASGLSAWPVASGVSYLGWAQWEESEDAMYSTLQHGGDVAELAEIRALRRDLWEP